MHIISATKVNARIEIRITDDNTLKVIRYKPEEEVYASIRLESRCLKRMKSTAAETAIVSPEMKETT